MSNTVPPLVGEGRAGLVTGLMAVYDRVKVDSMPTWVNLEAPSGWGKTRVVREFYRRLSLERQNEPTYWPPDILGQADEQLEVTARRKRLNPHVEHNPGSLPQYMWWGITCSKRNGLESLALAEDLSVFRSHAAYLDDAWRRLARRGERVTPGLRGFGKAVVDESAMEAGGRLIETALDTALPGLGLARWLGERSQAGIAAAQDRKARLQGGGFIEYRGEDLVAEATGRIARLAIPDLPMIIVVEDLHHADAALIEMLSTLSTRAGAVMIISTCVPGAEADNEHVMEAFERPNGKILRIDHGGGTLPAPFPPQASLAALTKADLAEIVEFYYENVEAETLTTVVERYSNPLMLELFCHLPRVRRQSRDGELRVSREEISRAPNQIIGLYRELWNQLSDETREVLTLVASCTPQALSPESSSATEWNLALVVDGLIECSWGFSERVAEVLHQDAVSNSWAREASEKLWQFIEPDQFVVALGDDDFVGLGDREDLARALSTVVQRRLSSSRSDCHPSEAVHLAETCLALHTSGHLIDSHVLAEAVRRALFYMGTTSRDAKSVVSLTSAALGQLSPDAPGVVEIRFRRGEALLALEACNEALADARWLLESHKVEQPDLQLRVRAMEARALQEAGQEVRASELFGEILRDWVSLVGVDHKDTVSARNNYALGLLMAGKAQESILQFETLLAEQSGRYDELAPELFTMRANLASALQSVGRTNEAIRLLEELVADETQVFGDDHPGTLASLNDLASAYIEIGRNHEAIEQLTALMDNQVRMFGPLSPEVMGARSNMTRAMVGVGMQWEAVDYAENLVRDMQDSFNLDHPNVLIARNNLVWTLLSVARFADAIALGESLIQDQSRVLGAKHETTMGTRLNVGHALIGSGRTSEAQDVLGQLFTDAIQVLGNGHPVVLAVKRALAGISGTVAGSTRRVSSDLPDKIDEECEAEGRLAEARRQVDEHIQAVDAEHPSVMDARIHLTRLLIKSGKLDEAMVQIALIQSTYVHIPDYLRRPLLSLVEELALPLGANGRHAEIVAVLEWVLEYLPAPLGLRSEYAMAIRSGMIGSLCHVGRFDEAAERLRGLLSDVDVTLGQGHPVALECHERLVEVLLWAERPSDALQAQEELVVVLGRFLGPEHRDTVNAKHRLRELVERAPGAHGSASV